VPIFSFLMMANLAIVYGVKATKNGLAAKFKFF
jgi:hypothetical protein